MGALSVASLGSSSEPDLCAMLPATDGPGDATGATLAEAAGATLVEAATFSPRGVVADGPAWQDASKPRLPTMRARLLARIASIAQRTTEPKVSGR